MNKRIDAHMHICRWYLGDEETSFDVLRAYLKRNRLDAVDNMACSNQCNLWGGYEPDQNILAAIMKLEVPESYSHACMYIPDLPADKPIPAEFDFVAQAEELMKIGFDGFKCCEFKPDSYRVHHMEHRMAEFERYFAYCEEHDIPMCWHVADPDTFWDPDKVSDYAKQVGWFYGDGTYPGYEALYDITLGLLDRHPDLRVMLAHAYFLSGNPEKVRAIFKKYPRVTLDLAPGWEMFDGFREHYDDWYEIFRTYADRIHFATDATLSSGIDYCSKLAYNVERFLTTTDEFETPAGHHARGIALSGHALDLLMGGNTVRIVGDEPKPIDLPLLRDYIKHYLPLLPDTRNKAAITQYYRKKLMK